MRLKAAFRLASLAAIGPGVLYGVRVRRDTVLCVPCGAILYAIEALCSTPYDIRRRPNVSIFFTLRKIIDREFIYVVDLNKYFILACKLLLVNVDYSIGH
jgi:hypothetical protein